MAYQRIEPFPENAETFGSSELATLGTIWREKKKNYREPMSFRIF